MKKTKAPYALSKEFDSRFAPASDPWPIARETFFERYSPALLVVLAVGMLSALAGLAWSVAQ